jgi:hypothetical protein
MYKILTVGFIFFKVSAFKLSYDTFCRSFSAKVSAERKKA